MNSGPSSVPAARPLGGILWMLLSGLFFTAVTVIVKHVAQSLPSPQVVFMRYAIGLVFVLPALPAMARAGVGQGLGLRFVGRGALHALGVLLWFYAMAHITIGEVTAMGYMQPVYITIGAVLFLGETIATRRIAAIGFAILGALLVLRPGFRELQPGHLAMLAVTPLFAASYLMAKTLAERTSAAATLGWMSVIVAVLLAPVAAWVWQPMTWVEFGWLCGTAALATAGHYAMLLAFRAAPITVTQPVTFLQLVWSVTFGALLFNEPVDLWVVLGGTVILGSVVFIAWREARLRRGQARAAAAASAP
ncbi:DMT family transporter [Frigidibacter sp. ROC022]|uniref:DMT family transporter n=1 Tax=Frigidibacter sp. ROC022 TaxID=2971796 RepID=UPI00215AB5AC|nr:DMT family transporter [Frigidibacter sp. ROC022]MCR8725818.1 DMT family transporter [Frigidibacter sp. ROC022]